MAIKTNKKILIVDDQAHFLEAVAQEVQLSNFIPITAQSGEEGLEIFRQDKEICLILSDMYMPNWDGKRFLQEIRNIAPYTPPFILMTGFADLPLYEACDMGADGMLGKPFHPKEFKDILERLTLPIETRWEKTKTHDTNLHITTTIKEIESIDFQLGRNGFFINKNKIENFYSFNKSAIVAFTITVDNKNNFNITGIGKIAWIRAQESALYAGCGIEFLYLEPESYKKILNYIQLRLTRKSIPKGENLNIAIC